MLDVIITMSQVVIIFILHVDTIDRKLLAHKGQHCATMINTSIETDDFVYLK